MSQKLPETSPQILGPSARCRVDHTATGLHDLELGLDYLLAEVLQLCHMKKSLLEDLKSDLVP